MADVPAEPEPPRFWRRFAKWLPMMLVFGIVGPVFLVIHLALDEPGTGWLLGWGIAITALDVGAALGLSWLEHRRDAKIYRLGRTGRRALADVLELSETHTLVNDEPLVKLRLRFHGDDVNPFEVEDLKVVPAGCVPLLRQDAVAVVVDPETKEWDFDWPASAGLRARHRPVPSIDQRLRELERLREQDLISTEEYAASRQRILDGL